MEILASLDRAVYRFSWSRYFYKILLPKAFELFARFILKFYAPVTVVGKENLPQEPFILVSNHHSHIDTTVLLVGSGKPFSEFGIMAAHDYFFEKKNVARYILNLLLLKRNSKSKNDFSKMVKFMHVWERFNRHNDKSIIMFPEGTRTKTGSIKPFKSGVGELAYTLNLPVVPCYIDGSEAVLKGTSLLSPGAIKLTIGEAVSPCMESLSSPSVSSKERYKDFADKLYQSVTALSVR